MHILTKAQCILVSTVAVVLCQQQQQKTIIPVHYGYFRTARPQHAACARGWLDLATADSYYQVTCHPQPSGVYASSRLDNGQLDIANLGSTPWAAAVSRGVDIQAVYIAAILGDSQGIYVRPSQDGYEGIKTPFDLEGRTVGAPFGSTVHYQLLFLIDLIGLTGKTNVVDMSPAELMEAWDDAARDPPLIDAAACWGSARQHILEVADQPGKELVSARLLADWGRPTFMVTAASREFAEAHPEFIQHLVGVISRLNDSFEDRLGLEDEASIVRWDGRSSPGTSSVPSVADSFMRSDLQPGSPSLELIFSVRKGMEAFQHVSTERQITCEFLGSTRNGCKDGLTSTQLQTLETAEFLVSQKRLPDKEFYVTSHDFLDGSYLAAARRTCTNCLPAGPYFPTRVSSSSSGPDLLLAALEANDVTSGRSAFAPVQVGWFGGDSTCSPFTVLAAQSGTFGDGADGVAGRTYSSNLRCSWLLRGADCEEPSGLCRSIVEVKFDLLKIWSADFLRVYSLGPGKCHQEPSTLDLDSPGGVLLGQLSGIDSAESLIFRDRGCILVTFETDGNVESSYGGEDGSGLKAAYSRDSMGCSSSDDCNGEPCTNGLCQCGGTKWGADCQHTEYCVGTQTIEIPDEGEVELASSMMFGDNASPAYPNALNCTFAVNAPGDSLLSIRVTLDSEPGFDLLHISSGATSAGIPEVPYATLSGMEKIRGLLVPTQDSYATIRFTTDLFGRRAGFKVVATRASSVAKIRCPPGYHGYGCELSHCIDRSRLLPARNQYSRAYSGERIVSHGSGGVPAMPWAPDGGCTWNYPSVPEDAVAIRLVFNQPLDLEPHPASAVGDGIIIRDESWGLSQTIFMERCESNEVCSFKWQTGICVEGACEVQKTIEIQFNKPNVGSSTSLSLVTDRNDEGKSYSGVDLDVLFVMECTGRCSANGHKCMDGFCYCGDVPCACSCDDTATSTSPAIKAAIGVVGFALVALLVYFLLYRRRKIEKSRNQKALLRAKDAEIEEFRKSVVGMCTASKQYVPSVSEATILSRDSGEAIWCWRETEGQMHRHTKDQIVGDAKQYWIKYSDSASQGLEAAYLEQGGTGCHSPLAGYNVDFPTMKQKKLATGFLRDVQRKVPPQDKKKSVVSIPLELAEEPQMVMIAGDVVQISKQRTDDWAYGTKLHHANEPLSRQLISNAGIDDSGVMTDTGWFPLHFTNPPSSSDLAMLKKNMNNNTGELAAPSYWDDVVDPSVAQRHVLDQTGAEYKSVADAFLYSLPPNTTKLISIERVQNLAMWQSYVVKRSTLCSREVNHSQNGVDTMDHALNRFERCWLWHGTSTGVLDKILQQGFNRSFCGKNATVYGKGVYFAKNANFAASRHYSVPDRNNRKHILACRVAVGEYCPGTHDALTPDVRDASKNLLYDSTVGLLADDSMESPSIYVTYHDSQAYPEYLITFKVQD